MAKYHGKYHYLGPWTYVLLDILYAIPVVGLIFMLSHAFKKKSENLCYYARACLLRILIAVVIIVVAVLIYYKVVGPEAFSQQITNIGNQINGIGNQTTNSIPNPPTMPTIAPH